VSRGAGSDDRTPILVGAGQLTQRDVAPAEALEPLAMMEVVARRAADDAGAGAALLAQVDSLAVVNVFCWPYANPPRLLAERLGIHPAEKLYTTVGGSTPQWLVNETAARIASGRVRVALLTGAEAVRTVMQARKARLRLRWSGGGDGPPSMVGDARDGTSEHEVAQGFMLPTQIYPLFENALRARAGRDLDRHRGMLGELCSRLSAVAAANPYSWFREARTADEIATVTPSNRMVAFPYPKLMNAIIEVDQAAGVLMTSVAEARALGIPRERWVHLWGTGQAHDRWFVSDRVDYVSSPAIREAGRQALDAAGIAIDRVDHLDLYSCFPAAVQIGRDMLGIAADDPRPLTVTGGLPYFGGPGNNYSMHAITETMARVRARPGSIGLVTALGWYITKHAVGVYSAAPKDGPFAREDPAPHQALLDAAPAPELALGPSGAATIETYTVLYDRDGAPMRGLVVGRLEDGRRFLAGTPDDPDVLRGLVTREAVGVGGRVTTTDGAARFDPA
jgi:acetyl-CoA C-acetyltransferase